jgi:hypothetical protein
VHINLHDRQLPKNETAIPFSKSTIHLLYK